MADSILRLRVQSEEYDNKLKRAAEGIRHLADVAHKGGGELTGLEKAEVDYIRALGEMETKSRSAAGQVRELENTYKELKVVYDQLNEVEKSDEGGKALAASLETLKQRAQDARAQMDAASQSLQTNASAGQEDSSALSMLADKFTINIDAIKLFNIGLQAAEGALSVAKDAFFASEATVDEWGRIMQSSQSLYEGFLNAINNSDISGFLSRMDDIVKAARAAYNELDTLGTMKTIQAPKMSAQQTENERLRMMIQTGRYIAPIDGRKASMQDGQLLTPAQIKTLERQLQNGMQNVVKLVGNEVKQTGKAIDAYYNSIAKQNGMSLQEFKNGTSSWEEFSKKMQGYQQYQKWRQENSFTDMYGNRQVREGNPYQEFKKWGTFRVDKMGENSFNDLVRLIQQRDQQAGQAYGMQSQAYRTMNRADGVTVSELMGRGGSGGGKNTITEEKDDFVEIIGLIGNAQEHVSDLQKQLRESWDQNEIVNLRKKLKDAQNELDVLQGKLPKDTVAEIHVKANIDDAVRKVKDIEGVTISQKEFTITATDEALPLLREIEGVTIDPKTFTITATDEALPLLEEIEGVTIDPKTFTITATDEALPLLREIEGVTIDPKTLTITANTTEALQKVQELVSDIDYTVVIPVTTDEDVERSIRQRYGKPVEMPVVPKTAGEQLEQQIRISIADSNIDADKATLKTLLETQIKYGIESVEIPTDALLNKIMGDGLDANIPDEYWSNLQDQINEKLKELGINPIKIDFKTGNISSGDKKDNTIGKQLEKFNGDYSKVTGGVSSIVSGIQQMGVEIPQEIQSVLGVLTGISSIMTGITALLTLIEIDTKTTAGASVFDAIIPLARGGVVKAAGGTVAGTTYSGDQIPALLNAGEVVLNRAQVSSLASTLEGGGMQGMKLSATISGEQIRLVLNNNGRRTGKGEYVQTNFR